MSLMKINTYNFLHGILASSVIPSTETINDRAYSKLSIFASQDNLNIVRIAMVIVALFIFILYRYWRKNLKFDKSYIYAIVSIGIFTMVIAVIATMGAISKSRNIVIGSSISIGNALEAPRDVAWDVEMKEEYIQHIKTAGFDTVRLPVRFSDYINDDGILEEEFMEKIDYYINYALNNDLKIILDMHHFDEIMENPEDYKDRFLSLWSQISDRYKDYSENLIFELLNEPKNNLVGDLWNEYLAEGVNTIRKTNKTRKIIVGAENYNSIYGLENLKLPKDKNLILTFHYYDPNDFAFQGNIYHEGYKDLKDIEWNGTEEEVRKINKDFEKVSQWAEKHKVQVYLGEFGINRNAPRKSRLRWIEQVRKTAEKYDFSWGYWEMASGFGIYDDAEHVWDEKALNSLLPNR